MLDNDIPEEINYSESFKLKKNAPPPPPIDDDIDEDLPVTESIEFKRRNRNKSPELSKVIDEADGDEVVHVNIPDSDNFKHINKLIKGRKDELETPMYQFTHVRTPNTISKASQKLTGLQKCDKSLVLTDNEKIK